MVGRALTLRVCHGRALRGPLGAAGLADAGEQHHMNFTGACIA